MSCRWQKLFSWDEATAHFAHKEGIVFCFGVAEAFCEELPPYLPLATELLPISHPDQISEALSPEVHRCAFLVDWQDAAQRRLREFLREVRIKYSQLPICVMLLPNSENVPTDLLADGTIDSLVSERSAPYVGAVLCHALLQSQRLADLEAQCQWLAERSERDPLTGLFNHGKITAELDDEFRKTKRTGEPLSALMLDIDHFKTLNDTYGHRVGDQVLRDLARRIKSSIRETDIVGRYGGEEFLFVLPSTNLEGAINLAEKVRRDVEQQTFQIDKLELYLTVSIGVASTMFEDVQNADHLVRLSDRALYFAKESGRNAVACAHEQVSLSEYDLRQRQRRPPSVYGPTIALCTNDRALHEKFVEIASANSYLLLSFEKPNEFFGAVEAYGPEIAIVDEAHEQVGHEFIRQLGARLHTQRVMIGIVKGQEQTPASQYKGIDFFLDTQCSASNLKETLELAIACANLERELIQTRQQLTHASQRQKHFERLATLGKMAGQLLDETALFVKQFEESVLQEKSSTPTSSIAQKIASELEQLHDRLRLLYTEKASLARKRLPLAAFVNRLTRSFTSEGPLGQSLGINIANQIGEDVEIYVDEELFAQALREVIANSIEAMPASGTLYFLATKDREGTTLTMIDEGEGIKEEIRSKIYEPFFTTRHGRGARGLGVPIAAAIIAEHGGTLQYRRAAPGTATIIWIPSGDEERTFRISRGMKK